jgi:hypothetical protein
LRSNGRVLDDLWRFGRRETMPLPSTPVGSLLQEQVPIHHRRRELCA